MAIEDELKALLQQYVTEGKQDKVTLRSQLERSTSAMGKIFHQLELHEQKDESRHELFMNEIKGIHSRLSDLERDVEDTGQHDLAELRASATWWKRFGTQTIVGVVVALMTGTVGVLVTLLVGKR